MPFVEYVLVELTVLIVSSAVLLGFVSKFKVPRRVFVLVMLPLSLFVIGFALRLSGEKELVDVGSFFTDFSFLVVYLIFAVSFVLGQVKYWKL
jgi:hypothetical protein